MKPQSHASPSGRALAELARQVRADTVRILEAAPAAALTKSPRGTANHILWHAGHAAWLGDALGVQLLTGRSELPSGWADRFGMDSSPAAWDGWKPQRAAIVAALRTQGERLVGLIRESDEARLWAPLGQEHRVADRIIHGLHDEAKHCGEMYLLLKLAWVEGARGQAPPA